MSGDNEMEIINIINIADIADPNDDLGRTYREVNNAKNHTFDIGQLVEFNGGTRMHVASHDRDCDGTPLYSLSPFQINEDVLLDPFYRINGVSEDGMAGINKEKTK